MPNSTYFSNLSSQLMNTGFGPTHPNGALINSNQTLNNSSMHMNLGEQSNPTYTILNRLPSPNLEKQKYFEMNSPNSLCFNSIDIRNHSNQMQNISSV